MHRRRNFRPKPAAVGVSTGEDDDSAVVAAFRQYARELDAKHDRHERIVKRSRDITIESKRIIFQLHSIRQRGQTTSASNNTNGPTDGPNAAPDGGAPNTEQAAAAAAPAVEDPATATVLRETRDRLDQLVRHSFAEIAAELHGRDAHQFVRAYSAGLQEFVEALTYWQYVAGERLSGWQQVEQMLSFVQPPSVPVVAPTKTVDEPPVIEQKAVDADAAGDSVVTTAADASAGEEATAVAAATVEVGGEKDTVVTAAAVAATVEVADVKDQAATGTAAATFDNGDDKDKVAPVAAVTHVCPVDPMEFMQGIGDFSGEVMRQCVNALGAGHFDTCFRGCALLRTLHTG